MADDTTTTPTAGEPERSSMAQLAAMVDGLDWDTIEVECPEASEYASGAEILEGSLVLECECGQRFRLRLDGGAHKCPGCGTRYRHLVVVQAEGVFPTAASWAIEDVLRANR